MKMNPIIKKTLQSKKTKKEKLAYLLYAYKEWLIGAIIIGGLAAAFFYSFTRPKEESYTLAVVSEAASDSQIQPKLSEAFIDQYTKKQQVPAKAIHVDFVSYEEPAAVQAFSARLAAGDIQAVAFKTEEANTWTKRFGTQQLPQEKFLVEKQAYSLQITNKKSAE